MIRAWTSHCCTIFCSQCIYYVHLLWCFTQTYPKSDSFLIVAYGIVKKGWLEQSSETTHHNVTLSCWCPIEAVSKGYCMDVQSTGEEIFHQTKDNSFHLDYGANVLEEEVLEMNPNLIKACFQHK